MPVILPAAAQIGAPPLAAVKSDAEAWHLSTASHAALAWNDFQSALGKHSPLWSALRLSVGKKGGLPRDLLPLLDRGAGKLGLSQAHVSLLYSTHKASGGATLGWNEFQKASGKKGLSRPEQRALYYVSKQLGRLTPVRSR